EVIELRVKPDDAFAKDAEGTLVSVNFCYKSAKNNYSIYAVGLNYDYVVDHGCYRQGLYQSLLRANTLGCDKFYLGMDASVEKKRFGVTVFPVCAYVQANDNFNLELIGTTYSSRK
ncbi:MAG TPA: hypothetical protein VKQ08_01485, partial [Cyclobacteriaceae bacterium]|nr:hypothetical protein [Cyclobacteriaceae bacterium]